MTLTALRLPDDLIARIDAYAARQREKNPGLNRSDAIRMLLITALESEEGRETPTKRKR